MSCVGGPCGSSPLLGSISFYEGKIRCETSKLLLLVEDASLLNDLADEQRADNPEDIILDCLYNLHPSLGAAFNKMAVVRRSKEQRSHLAFGR